MEQKNESMTNRDLPTRLDHTSVDCAGKSEQLDNDANLMVR